MANFPTVNGQYFSWSDIEATALAPGVFLPLIGWKAINYKSALSKQKVRGNASVSLGTTKGKYEANGDVELYLPQANLLISSLGPGWMQIPISFQISYVSSGPLGVPAPGLPQPVITDTIPFCYLADMDASQSESDEPLTRKFTLTIPGQIMHNGLPDVIENSFSIIAVA